MNTQMNIPLSKTQHMKLKSYAKDNGVTMAKVVRDHIDSLNGAYPTPNFIKYDTKTLAEAITGFCRPCDSMKESLQGKCVTCGEWTVIQ